MVSVSDEELNELGDQVAENMVEHYGEYDDSALFHYVEGVGRKIEGAAPVEQELKFYILDTDIVNAFSVPGGHIFVTRGLLARVNSEAELAMVLGHEVGHLTARHSAQRISQIRTSGFFSNLVAILVAVWTESRTAGSLAGTIVDFSSVLAILNYGREAEFEADALGQKFEAKAGYDPEAGRKFLKTLESMEKHERSGIEALLATHPPSGERVERAEILAEDLKESREGPFYGGENAYKMNIKGIVVGPSLEGGFVKEDVYYNKKYMFTLESFEDWFLGTSARYKAGLVKKGNLFLVYAEKPLIEKPLDEWSTKFLREALENEKLILILKERNFKGLPAYYDKFEISGKHVRALMFSKDSIYYALTYTYQPAIFVNYDELFEKLINRFDFMDPEIAAGITEERMRVYSAKSGDAWEGLSLKFYNDVELADKFRSYNGMAEEIEENQVIKLPPLKYLKKV